MCKLHKKLRYNSVALHMGLEIAAMVLGVLASSASVERPFSVARKVFRPKRGQLVDVTPHKLIFIQM